MIRHIVMWKIKENVEGRSKLEDAKIVKKALEDLKNDIKEIISIEVGIIVVEGEGAYDIVLNAEYASLEDLVTYQKHPAHVEVVKNISQYLEPKVFVDYEF